MIALQLVCYELRQELIETHTSSSQAPRSVNILITRPHGCMCMTSCHPGQNLPCPLKTSSPSSTQPLALYSVYCRPIRTKAYHRQLHRVQTTPQSPLSTSTPGECKWCEQERSKAHHI